MLRDSITDTPLDTLARQCMGTGVRNLALTIAFMEKAPGTLSTEEVFAAAAAVSLVTSFSMMGKPLVSGLWQPCVRDWDDVEAASLLPEFLFSFAQEFIYGFVLIGFINIMASVEDSLPENNVLASMVIALVVMFYTYRMARQYLPYFKEMFSGKTIMPWDNSQFIMNFLGFCASAISQLAIQMPGSYFYLEYLHKVQRAFLANATLGGTFLIASGVFTSLTPQGQEFWENIGPNLGRAYALITDDVPKNMANLFLSEREQPWRPILKNTLMAAFSALGGQIFTENFVKTWSDPSSSTSQSVERALISSSGSSLFWFVGAALWAVYEYRKGFNADTGIYGTPVKKDNQNNNLQNSGTPRHYFEMEPHFFVKKGPYLVSSTISFFIARLIWKILDLEVIQTQANIYLRMSLGMALAFGVSAPVSHITSNMVGAFFDSLDWQEFFRFALPMNGGRDMLSSWAKEAMNQVEKTSISEGEKQAINLTLIFVLVGVGTALLSLLVGYYAGRYYERKNSQVSTQELCEDQPLIISSSVSNTNNTPITLNRSFSKGKQLYSPFPGTPSIVNITPIQQILGKVLGNKTGKKLFE